MNLCTLLFFLSALQVSAVLFDSSRQPGLDVSFHQPGHDGDAKAADKESPSVLDNIHDTIKGEKKKVMDDIEKFRAEICANMKEEYGIEFDTFKACHEFMEKTCHPGKDETMDGDSNEVTSGKGYCKEYFPPPKPKPKVEKKATIAASPYPSPGPVPAPAPAPSKEDAAPAPAPKEAAASAKPAPAPAPAPGPAGAPGAPAPLPADEAYYYKNDMGRLHMKEDMKLPTQGYWGKLVEHEDMETATSDWQKEFGPKSGHGSVAEVCRKNPDSLWCMRRGYGKRLRSSGQQAVAQILPVAMVFLAARIL